MSTHVLRIEKSLQNANFSLSLCAGFHYALIWRHLNINTKKSLTEILNSRPEFLGFSRDTGYSKLTLGGSEGG